MNLEQLITEAYSKHQAELQAAQEAQKLKEQQETERAIAKPRSQLNGVITPEIQACLNIEFTAKLYDSGIARFIYKDTEFYIQYGPYTGGEWGVWTNKNGFPSHVRSEGLLNYLLIQLGQVRDSEPEPEPEMTLEHAADILGDCFALAENVYDKRHDFIHNPEEFGENLKTAICLLRKLSDELALSCSENE